MFSFDRKILRHVSTVALPALVATLVALIWPPERAQSPFIAPLHNLERAGYDAFFALRGKTPQNVDEDIVVVGFDQTSESHVGSWPVPRRHHAKVLENLTRDGAKVVVLDLLFTTASDPEDDKILDKALKATPRVVLCCRIDRDASAQRKALIAPYYDDKLGIDFEANALLGFAEVARDPDGIVRRFGPAQVFQGEGLPSLAGAAYLAATGKTGRDVRVTADRVTLGDLTVPCPVPSQQDPADPKALFPSAYVNFAGGLYTFRVLRYEDVHDGTFPPGTFKDRVVFVGLTGSQLAKEQGEVFTTAFSRWGFVSEDAAGGVKTPDVYGVILQAHLYNSLVKRAFVTEAPPLLTWITIFGFSLLGTWGVRHTMTWRGPLLLLISIAAYTLLVFQLFRTMGIHLPWVLPDLLLLGSAGGVAWLERGKLRKKWSGYVSPAYLEVMLREGIETKAIRCNATVIFGDIRGFTKFSEKHEPATVVRLLDKHFDKMVRLIFDAGGTIDKFLGDGIVVVFGAPQPMDDAAHRAVRTAWLCREAAEIPIVDVDGQSHTLSTGFGIATGEMVVGDVGSKDHKEFTLIGDTVNLSARLQGVTGKPDVIIDEPTYQIVRDRVDVDYIGAVELKGKAQPVPCYVVTAWYDDPPARKMPEPSAPEKPAQETQEKAEGPANLRV